LPNAVANQCRWVFDFCNNHQVLDILKNHKKTKTWSPYLKKKKKKKKKTELKNYQFLGISKTSKNYRAS
jgi:hypothetical protein